MTHIAFIGLGNMGGPMAVNLVQSEHRVTVFDLSVPAMDSLKREGASVADSALSAVKDADIVVTMLPAAQHVERLYLGNKGIIRGAKPGTLFIDSSTIDADTAKRVGADAYACNMHFIDAPVSGGTAGAKAGTLTFIMGGSPHAVAQATPVLQCMGRNLFHAGDLGAGQIAKICNNMLLAVLMAGTSEALTMATKNGIDPKVMSDIMLQSSGCNWTLEKYNPCPDVMENVPSSNQYEGGFMVKLMNKDLNLAMNTAADSVSTTPMATAAQSLYRMLESQGHGEKDFSSVYTLFNKHTNT